MSRYIINILILLTMPAMAMANIMNADTIHVATVDSIASDTVKLVQVDSVFAINRAEHTADTIALKMPVYQGTYLNLDIFNPIATAFNGGRFEFVVSADVDLWHRLFPVLEYGMMFMNKDYTTYKYKTDGLFLRVGAMYNFLNAKPDRKKDHSLSVGVRYAYSNVNYTLSDVQLTSPDWKDESVTVSNNKKVANVGWVEFVASLNVQIYKDFFMGITARVKTFSHFYAPCLNYPTFIPGFGEYTDSAVNFGFDYTLTYRIPSKKVKKYRESLAQ
ncbi:MAG: DUF6048 family protein [Paludibacteraceae bacterium]|nr:DUF6048 family protein [Paludibacteraceae bacterium]